MVDLVLLALTLIAQLLKLNVCLDQSLGQLLERVLARLQIHLGRQRKSACVLPKVQSLQGLAGVLLALVYCADYRRLRIPLQGLSQDSRQL